MDSVPGAQVAKKRRLNSAKAQGRKKKKYRGDNMRGEPRGSPPSLTLTPSELQRVRSKEVAGTQLSQ